jgi:digeranylgeranylglycerophospholipid reductase
MIQKSDVCVIGGGPSGLRLAGRLAEAGLHVCVLEKKTAVGSGVICTGIVGKEAFGEFGLNTDSVLREIQSVRLVSPSHNSILYSHPVSFAYVVDREKFDRNLAAKASELGAEIMLGMRAEDVRIDPERVEVQARTEGGDAVSFTARLMVLATGIDYGLQKKLDLGRPREFLSGAQAEIETTEDLMTTIFVGRGVAPGAFGWAVPSSPGRVRIGMLTGKDSRTCLADLIREFYAGRFADFDQESIRVKAIAQGLLSRTFGDRVLALGEAAGQIKTTTGGGIYYGLVCADIAAAAVRECFATEDFSASALSAYEKNWKSALQKEIILGHMTRRMCARLSDSQIERIFRLAQTDGILPIIREKADFDWHGDLILALVKRLSFMKTFRGMSENPGIGKSN